MKRLNNRLLLFLFLLLLSACKGGESQKRSSTAIEKSNIVFQNLLHDFGVVKRGDEVGAVFGFVNDGEYPVVIQKVEAGCGCTAVNYTKTLIEPSAKGFVEVIFDSHGQQGYQRKNVRVFANIPEGSILLTVIAVVE